MITYNNSDLDTQQLAEKAEQIQRRRARPTDSKLPVFQLDLNSAKKEISPPVVQESDGPSHSPQDHEKTVARLEVKRGVFAYLLRRYEKVTQPGIGLRQRIRLIPGLGYAIAWCNALLRLPVTRHHNALTLAHLQQQVDSLQQQVNSLQQQVDSSQHALLIHEQRISQLESLKLANRLERYDALDIGTRLMQLDRLQIARQLKSVNLMMRTGLQREDALIARINKLEQDNDGTPLLAGISAAGQCNNFKPEDSNSNFNQDQFYLEFEDMFGGSREDIKQRLKVYLSYLSHITSLPKKDRPMVVDVGCGRGEWLELLDEQEIPAIGVDMNASMVDACLQNGFVARHADAIAYLREQPQGSVGAVTGFYIIEHLSFKQLIALLDAAQHALCPGGVIIFETPNPENLMVGACNFYFDPTHLHPIVPQVAEFMAKQRGFAHAEILRLHPYPDDHRLHGGTEVEVVINKVLFGPQDYALIGRK